MPATPKSRTRRGRASASPAPVKAQSPATGDVVPGRLPKSEWVTMVTREEGEEAVAEILEELMCSVMEKCFAGYLNRQLLPFTVSRAQDTLVRVLEWQFLMQDRGEGPHSAPLWVEDSEPQPGVTDSWADGSVPVRSSSPVPHTPTPQAGPCVPKSPQKTTAPPVCMTAAPQTKQNIQPMNQTDTGLWDLAEEHQGRATEHKETGSRGIRPIVHPPPKREEGRVKRQPPPQTRLPALRTPPPPLLGVLLTRTPSPEEPNMTAVALNSTPVPQPPDLPSVPRLNPNRLPRRFVCPGFEVLKPSPLPLPSSRRGGHPPQPPMPYEGLPKWASPAGPVCVFSTRNLQDDRPPQGYTPLSASLLLDTMKLSQGVSARGRARTSNERPHHPEGALKPIRGTLPISLVTRDRLTLGPPPRVIPLLSTNDTVV